MSSVYDILNRSLKGETTGHLSERIGATQEQTQNALRAAVPTLVTALSNNARRPRGAAEILEALRRDHDGSVLDDVDGHVRGGQDDAGEGILRHVLGDNRGRVEEGVSQFAGMDAKSIGKLLVVLAPLIMGVLGKMRKNKEVESEGDLRKILRREERTSQQQGGGGIGDILKKVLRGGGTGQSQGGGCLSMLGPLLRTFGK